MAGRRVAKCCLFNHCDGGQHIGAHRRPRPKQTARLPAATALKGCVLVIQIFNLSHKNGTQMDQLLMATAMGEYAVKADPNLIYRNDKVRSVNDHQAGFLAYRKKRSIFVEETDPLKFLDEELLKDMNGGQTSFTVRQMWRDDVVTFDWISKIFIAFNEGKMPGFNIADAALVDRMPTVPH